MSENHANFNISEEISLPLKTLMVVIQESLNCILAFRVLTTLVIISSREVLFFLLLCFNFINYV